MHLTGNSHIDAAWLWPWTETVDVVKRTFSHRTAVDERISRLHLHAVGCRNTTSGWRQSIPQINDEIKQRIKEGRWEIVGGMWVEPDLNMPDGESQVRSLLVGKRLFQKEYGVDVRIGWNPDSFGYNWQLPQIYKTLRHRLLRHAEDDLERHQPASVQALLVGVARRQQGPDLLPA